MTSSNVRVLGPSAHDWRHAEAAWQEAVVATVNDALAMLTELETQLGEEDDVAHGCRSLAASLRAVRNTRNARAAMLRAELHDNAPPDGWADE